MPPCRRQALKERKAGRLGLVCWLPAEVPAALEFPTCGVSTRGEAGPGAHLWEAALFVQEGDDVQGLEGQQVQRGQVVVVVDVVPGDALGAVYTTGSKNLPCAPGSNVSAPFCSIRNFDVQCKSLFLALGGNVVPRNSL